MMSDLIELRGIGGVLAGKKLLDQISFTLPAGQILAICSADGAARAMLARILSGGNDVSGAAGEVLLGGRAVRLRSVRAAQRHGIVHLARQPAVVADLSVAENLFMAGGKAGAGLFRWPARLRAAKHWLGKIGLDVPPGQRAGDLSPTHQQLLCLARALAAQPQLLILEEPETALPELSSAGLLGLLRQAGPQDMAILVLSQRPDRMRGLADHIAVLRDARLVLPPTPTAETTEEQLLAEMTGRDRLQRYPVRRHRSGDLLFELRGWTVRERRTGPPLVRGVSFELRAGEVLGITGTLGSGGSELGRSISGPPEGCHISGQAFLRGRRIDPWAVRDTIRAGIAFLPGAGEQSGLIADATIRSNLTLANLAAVSRFGVCDPQLETAVARRYQEALRIRTPSVHSRVRTLTAGDRQKVALAKWMFAAPDVLILDEPAEGADVTSRHEIFSVINNLSEQGKAVILISRHMQDLMGMCDRVCIMREGAVVNMLEPARQSREPVILLGVMT